LTQLYLIVLILYTSLQIQPMHFEIICRKLPASQDFVLLSINHSMKKINYRS